MKHSCERVWESDLIYQVLNGYFHLDEPVGWQVVGAKIIQVLALIPLVYRDWMNT